MGVTRNEMLALIPNIIATKDEVISTIQFLVQTKLIIPVGILDVRSDNSYILKILFINFLFKKVKSFETFLQRHTSIHICFFMQILAKLPYFENILIPIPCL